MTTRILAHAIGGCYELRHEGCAPKCCEAEAEVVQPDSYADREADIMECGACERPLRAKPLPLDFDPAEMCDTHAWAAEHHEGGRLPDEGAAICMNGRNCTECAQEPAIIDDEPVMS